jgi:hypothetical protein
MSSSSLSESTSAGLCPAPAVGLVVCLSAAAYGLTDFCCWLLRPARKLAACCVLHEAMQNAIQNSVEAFEQSELAQCREEC